jgi:exosome complex exonuclease RRP6
MMKYAREDTHYLLYIYDCMKNELVERGNATNNLILAVLNRRFEELLFAYFVAKSYVSKSMRGRD